MGDEAVNIFSGSSCLSQQQLVDYLQGKMTEAEKNAVERHLTDCELCSDALEGLSAVQYKEQIPAIVQQIHGQLRRELQNHQSKRKRLRLYVWLSLVVVIVLLILLVAFFAIHYTLRHEQQLRQPPPERSVSRPA